MASQNTAKKPRTKPPRSRPAATSTLSQPVVEDASYLTAISSFSPNGNMFAFLSLALDKHRLRVYDTATGHSAAEHVVESARVTSLIWARLNLSSSQEEGSAPPSKKKRKKRNSVGGDAAEENLPATETVVLGLSDGTVLFFSPTHGRVMRTLSHPTSTAAIVSVEIIENALWTSGADGAVRLWDAHKNDISGSWKTDDRIPYSSMAVRPHSEQQSMLVASHTISLLSLPNDASSLETQKPKQLASFTGHASSIKHLQWDASQKPATRFVTAAEADRFVYVWQLPEAGTNAGKMVASIPLDSDVRAVSFSISDSGGKQNLLTVSASGKVSVFPVPSEFTVPPTSSNKTQHKLPTLVSRTSISAPSKKDVSIVAHVAGAAFVSEEQGQIRVARIVSGVRPIFDLVQYINEAGEFIPEVTLDEIPAGLASESKLAAPNKRYAEAPSLAIRSGVEIGQDADMDDLAVRDVDGDLDVDIAELSLGQRLTALSGADDAINRATTSESEEEPTKTRKSKKKSQQDQQPNIVPANSLTRTLIQALHSSDARLLETCLAHSDQSLIRNTVRRLPPQLAVPLITACVERLGRGARAGNMKGGGGGASSQRGTGLIVWIKTVLAVHSGHLMTMPDLVARLSGLHATLTTRLTLQDSLLSLSGRLDMVLSQIEMRSSTAPAPLAPQKGKSKSGKATGKQVSRYVEGESEDEEMQVEVEVDSGDESVEDVQLGGSSDEESESGEEDSEDEEDSDGPTMNGFIDDEAEEEYTDDEDEDSE